MMFFSPIPLKNMTHAKVALGKDFDDWLDLQRRYDAQNFSEPKTYFSTGPVPPLSSEEQLRHRGYVKRIINT